MAVQVAISNQLWQHFVAVTQLGRESSSALVVEQSKFIDITQDSLHIGRFQEYFNHIHVFIGSSTSQFLQF
jgi:hypothetical protein